MTNAPQRLGWPSTLHEKSSTEPERALARLRKQMRALETLRFRRVNVEFAARSGALPPPRLVFLLDDDRALAWFGETLPYIVHPSFADLCGMHGVRATLVRAA